MCSSLGRPSSCTWPSDALLRSGFKTTVTNPEASTRDGVPSLTLRVGHSALPTAANGPCSRRHKQPCLWAALSPQAWLLVATNALGGSLLLLVGGVLDVGPPGLALQDLQ